MAGVKGKSGGPRPNSGGKRAGAGRKPKAKATESANQPGVPAPAENPLAFLLSVQNNMQAPLKDRIRASVAAAQYLHLKKGDGGIKDDRKDAAKKAGGGKFGPRKAPTLVVSNR
ncbi:MAG: hypothetical protein HYZ17_16290 [Betaproteobacteria bacterium]|nr:hypothetical protein [Betaproteobacteria bacterium]